MAARFPSSTRRPATQVSPALTWTNAPPTTQSFVLHMHDMEGPRNKTTEDQLHWLVWNIPGDDDLAARGRADRSGSEGRQPPDERERQRHLSRSRRAGRRPAASLRVRDLRARHEGRTSPANAADPFDTRAKVMSAMQGHIIGKAVYMGLFHRPE